MTKHFWKKNHHQQQSKIMVNYIAKGKEKRTALVLLLAKKKDSNKHLQPRYLGLVSYHFLISPSKHEPN
jgi:hypothetical protein